ncbi:hypothetical protein VLK31_35930 [Variovorax sp. H27-G14]|uniref:hypothetical protein n=1 Tax=Variovorax sp. H27-G14 TaxID=3111914 RepID=UPI0038FC8F12
MPAESRYLSTVEITKGLQVCAAPGQWFGLRELQISENGNHVIFHAKRSGSNGLRGVYLASYAEKECRLEVVFLEKDEKWELQQQRISTSELTESVWKLPSAQLCRQRNV